MRTLLFGRPHNFDDFRVTGIKWELVGSDLESLLSGRVAVAVGGRRRLELHPLA